MFQNKMENKIRVVHYCNQLSLGGTEKTMEIFCRLLDKSKFDVHVVSRIHSEKFLKKMKLAIGGFFGNKKSLAKIKNLKSMNARIPRFQSFLDSNHLHFVRNDQELEEVILSLKPEILHVHYSGRAEPPTSNEKIMSSVPKIFTTNQFELENTSPSHAYVKNMFFVSNWLLQNKALWAKNDPRSAIIYNPVDLPLSQIDLREKYGIPKDAFVVGRVGRPDNGIHDPISILAYKEIQNEKTYFLALSPPDKMVEEAKTHGLKNFIPIPPTTDEHFISSFYNTIDVLAHARRDGETFGCNIAEAMIHGKPVISHISDFMNAQIEVIGDGGFVCEKGDSKTYAMQLKKLLEDKTYYNDLATRATSISKEKYESGKLTKLLTKYYLVN